MGKRKNSDNSDAIRRKIKKLQKKLRKKEEEQGTPPRPFSPAESRSPSPAEVDVHPEPTAEPNHVETLDEEEIPREFLEALGSEGICLDEVGPPIHQQLVARWTNIITEGLSKEAITNIIKRYPTPSNFKLVMAPEINPELLAALSEPSLKRDKRIMARQNLLGKAMTCIGQVLTDVMSGNINSKIIIEKLSDAAKITAETFCEDSKSRRFFALAGTTATVREALKNAKTDGTLLGMDCAERIKAAQAMQKTAAQINVNERYIKSQMKGNWKSPLPQHRSGPSFRQPQKQRKQQIGPRARQQTAPRARQQTAPRTRQQTAPRGRQQRWRSPTQHRYR